MRGHGNTVVGPDIRETVSRAIYTELNARLLLQTLTLGRPIEYLDPAEAESMMSRSAGLPNVGKGHGVDRIWQMWLDEVRRTRVRFSERTSSVEESDQLPNSLDHAPARTGNFQFGRTKWHV